MGPILIWAVVVVAFFQNCATPLSHVGKKNYPYKELNSYEQVIESKNANYSNEKIKNPTGTLNIKQAASLVLIQNPHLSTFPYEIRAREALALQAGLRPNPELETELEDFAGTGDFEVGDRVEITAFYSQLIERGEKREKRYQLGVWEGEMARWDYRTAKLDVLSLLAQRYLDVLAGQERVAILQELVKLSEEALHAISERVKAGRVSPLEKTRARVELASQRNALDAASKDLASAKSLLASIWGVTTPEFGEVSGKLDRLHPVPELKNLLSKVENNPDVQRWAAEMERRKTVFELEEAQAVPDITLTGGLRYRNESEDASLIGAISIPLKIYDRNQGAIQAAEERLQKAILEREAVITEVKAKLSSVYQRLQGAKSEIERLQTEILPGALRAYEAAREGYRQGEFGYLDVLDAQRTLFQSRVQYIQALDRFHQQWIALERLIGQPLLDDLSENQ